MTLRLPPPRLEHIKQTWEASPEQRLAVLRWAAQWSGHKDYRVSSLLPVLDDMLGGQIGPRDGSPAETILRVAMRLLGGEARVNSILRTVRAFPFIELKVMGPPHGCCAAARRKAGQLLPSRSVESLPLDDCTKIACHCIWRQFTQGEIDRGREALERSSDA